ncbi:MAG TPA: RNA-binding protein hfq [Cyanobacteria bacterium UBA8543]|nr:RNA-binding protein hfq [Cyanobacteria bacterium UBA8543]
MAEFDVGIPSVRQIQGFIKQGQEVELKLLTQDLLIGYLRWQDQDCVCINTQDGQNLIIWRHAIAYIKLQNGAGDSRSLQVFEG